MPTIDFPSTPSVNDEYTFEGRTWLWNGSGWELKSNNLGTGAMKNITISTSNPTGGSDGDIWIKYTA
jgi:hypothetical protein